MSERSPRTLQLSRWIAVVGGALVYGLGAWQLGKDGSLWRDEAAVAQSLLHLSPQELLGPLEGQQSFPRLYLLAIRALQGLFGYETLTLRALPQLFFALSVFGSVRLLHLRFRAQPEVLASAIALTLLATPLFVYAAMLKPYTLFMWLALVPLLLSDDFFDDALTRGRKPWRLFALAAGIAFSATFAIALLARVGGWWLAALPRGSGRVSPSAVAWLVAGVAGFGALLWWSELRHTSQIAGPLRDFWKACLAGAPGTDTPTLLRRFVLGWYDGSTEFSKGRGLPDAVLAMVGLAFALGVVRAATACFVELPGGPVPAKWGSRSLCALLVPIGALTASLLAGYPVCAGRLTLFALLPLQILTLEGIAWVLVLARRLPGGAFLSGTAGLAWLVAIAGPAAIDAAHLAGAPTPDDMRRLLEITREHPELPILTTGCTRAQIETLPEWRDVTRTSVLYLQQSGALAAALEHPKAWVLYATNPFCAKQIQRLRGTVPGWESRGSGEGSMNLALIEFSDRFAPNRARPARPAH